MSDNLSPAVNWLNAQNYSFFIRLLNPSSPVFLRVLCGEKSFVSWFKRNAPL